ncbi:MAG: AAA family ATPase [Alphaproteobacteria bacterium]|nr:AAA family ATPase [Alphaproteobacteria bacterium]
MNYDWTNFNNAQTQDYPKEEESISVDEIKTRFLSRLREALNYLLPTGAIRSGKFYVGNIKGNKGDSLVVELSGTKAGQWHDFATGEGGDIIDLWAGVSGKDRRRDFPEIISAMHEWLGISHTTAKLEKELAEDLGPVTGKWDYQDADGNLIACVYRYDPPGGKQFRPWDVKTRRNRAPEIRPLYNQPGIKFANSVVLVEGEKAAQALIEKGICATTAMNGANTPIDKTDWSSLTRKHVTIWPDNDDPGFKYAEAVATRLKTQGIASLSILSIPNNKPVKWDAADAVLEGMDIPFFLASSTRSTITLTSAIPAYRVEHYLNDDSPIPSDIISPRVLTPGGLLVLGGAPKVGKSDLLTCWLAHMVAGIPFLGMMPPRPLKVFYLQAEIGYHYLRERLRNINIDPLLMPLVGRNLVITPQVRMLLDEGGVEKVVNTIIHFFDPAEVDIIVIDPLRNVYDGGKAGGENDNSAMMAFLQERVEDLRNRINPNAGIILAHHTKKINKKSLEEDPFQSFSGAGALRSFYSTGIIMFKPDETRSVKQLMFELRNGSSIENKYVDKIDGRWRELDFESERLVNKDYGQKLDAERRRKHDTILEIIFQEARKGTLYTGSMFTQVWEHKASLGGKHSIRDRIEVLTSKGYIKFVKDGAARSRNGFLCVEDMEMPTDKTDINPITGEVMPIFKRLLPTHFRSPSDGSLMPIEDPEIWIYHEGVCE